MKVGDYVRTKKGTIYQFNSTSSKALSGVKKYMVKSSPNIIDLIEVGDYVNGDKVFYIDDCKGTMKEYYYDYENPNNDCGHFEEEIKSIVTKEQFSQMEYKVGEE